jgi:hypothetical protein
VWAMSNTWKQKYDRMFAKARRKRQELEERIAEVEIENARLRAACEQKQEILKLQAFTPELMRLMKKN